MTLTELVVVILIVLAMVLVSIPLFLKLRNRDAPTLSHAILSPLPRATSNELHSPYSTTPSTATK